MQVRRVRRGGRQRGQGCRARDGEGLASSQNTPFGGTTPASEISDAEAPIFDWRNPAAATCPSTSLSGWPTSCAAANGRSGRHDHDPWPAHISPRSALIDRPAALPPPMPKTAEICLASPPRQRDRRAKTAHRRRPDRQPCPGADGFRRSPAGSPTTSSMATVSRVSIVGQFGRRAPGCISSADPASRPRRRRRGYPDRPRPARSPR